MIVVPETCFDHVEFSHSMKYYVKLTAEFLSQDLSSDNGMIKLAQVES